MESDTERCKSLVIRWRCVMESDQRVSGGRRFNIFWGCRRDRMKSIGVLVRERNCEVTGRHCHLCVHSFMILLLSVGTAVIIRSVQLISVIQQFRSPSLENGYCKILNTVMEVLDTPLAEIVYIFMMKVMNTLSTFYYYSIKEMSKHYRILYSLKDGKTTTNFTKSYFIILGSHHWFKLILL